MSHSGEKPHKCQYCNKGYIKKSDCTIHERTHTGETNSLICVNCDKTFTTCATLSFHSERCGKQAKQFVQIPHSARDKFGIPYNLVRPE